MTAVPTSPAPRDLAAAAELAGDVVRGAGELAARMRADGVRSQRKSSISDIVTDADHASERYVARRLRALFPEDGMVGEEGAAHPGTSGWTWVIDPVDGTYNYASGSDYWCAALALRPTSADPADSNSSVLGAVYRPASGDLWLGGPDLPTTRNGRALPRLTERSLSESCVYTYCHPPSFADAHTGPFGPWARLLGRAATYRVAGSASVDLGEVARGMVPLWVQHALPEWDRLPGAALVRGAGGAVRDVAAGGVVFTVAGTPGIVAEAAATLTEG